MDRTAELEVGKAVRKPGAVSCGKVKLTQLRLPVTTLYSTENMPREKRAARGSGTIHTPEMSAGRGIAKETELGREEERMGP